MSRIALTPNVRAAAVEYEALLRNVVFVPIAVEAAERLEAGEVFEGTIRLVRDPHRPGEADLQFTRS